MPPPTRQRTIRRATPDDAAILTELTFRSKAHWGYSAEFMETARLALTITPAMIENSVAFVLEEVGRVCGYYALEKPDGDSILLESLFIDADAIGTGCGEALLKHALAQAAEGGHRIVKLEADPNAEGFYRRMGAERIGQRESSIPGRFLPMMRFVLNGADDVDCESQQRRTDVR